MKTQTGLVRLVDYDKFVNRHPRNRNLIKQYFNTDYTINIDSLEGVEYVSGYIDKKVDLCIINNSEWQYFEPVTEEETNPISFTHKVIAISEYEALVNIKAKYDKIVSAINS